MLQCLAWLNKRSGLSSSVLNNCWLYGPQGMLCLLTGPFICSQAEIEHFVNPEDKRHPKFASVAELQPLLYSRAMQMSE
jgi:hypothetical protein